MKKTTSMTFLWLSLLFLFLIAGIFIGRLTSKPSVSLGKPISQTESKSRSTENGRININTATAEQLTQLPRIGSVLAQRIVQYRLENGPFSDVRELLNVKGIGESILEEITALISTGGNE